MNNIINESNKRQQTAFNLLKHLQLVEQWSRYGKPYLLGAVTMGVVWNRDIDMNIYCKEPRYEFGKDVMEQISKLPAVTRVEFHDFMDTPDQGLYWKITCKDEEDNTWKIDNWLVADDHPDAGLGEGFSKRMNEILTPENRLCIISLKKELENKEDIRGMDIYRAVIEGKVKTKKEFEKWHSENKNDIIVKWTP